MTMSTPYGLPSVFSSIQVRTASSSSASLNRTQPSTPSPPARLIAAATCSDGVKPKIGWVMPNWSQSGVRTGLLRDGRRRTGWPTGSRPCRWPAAAPCRRTRCCAAPCSRRARRGRAWSSSSARRRRAGPRFDDRGHALPEPLVRDADDEHVEHVRVRHQRRLDLFGEDLLAAGVDAGVAAAEQRDRAVGLVPREVAGHGVALAVDLDEQPRGLLRVLVVAERDVPAAGQPADLVRAGRDRRCRPGR